VTLFDLVRFASTALTRHRLRSVLSLLGVSIGVAAVVLLTALGEGARRYVTSQFEALGTNLVIVIPGKTETQGALPGIGGAPNDLTIDDALALKRRLPDVDRVVPVVVGPETLSRRERSRQVVVIGATHEFLAVRRLQLGQGSNLPELDPERATPVTVLGHKLAQELCPGESAVGKVVRIGDWRMRVIGVLAPGGTRVGLDTDELAIIPVGTGMKLFNRSSLFRILMDVSAHAEMESVQERAVAILTERHDDEEDVTILTQDSVLGSFSAILGALTIAVGGIAAISLTVAGIGIMNVMLVSVSERTSEVGLLKALGATHRQVLSVFLTEAILLSTTGGLAGLTVGLGIGSLVHAFYPQFDLTPPTWAVVAAIAVSVGSGALFGVLPARRATRLDPVEALAKRTG
jgi:putative ABC transport system permease protein